MHLFDTKRFWHDLDHRARIIERLRERGGELLDEEAVWKTKQGRLVHVLVSYAQVAYRGGHVSFVGGKRVLWVYDITALREREAQIAEQERQFHDLLEHCPAGLSLVDEEGRLVFHNAGLRALLGYEKEELHLFDTRQFWHDLDHRTRIIETLRQRGGQLMNEEVIWKTKEGRPVHTLMSYVQVAYQGGHVGFAGGKRVAWLYDVSALKQREAPDRRSGAPVPRAPRALPGGPQPRRRGGAPRLPQCAPARDVRLRRGGIAPLRHEKVLA